MIKTILTIALLFLLYPLHAKEIEYKDYYPNGKLHYQFHKKNNALHGSYIYWHQNGQKAVEGNFKKGKREGIWKAWYENGNQVYERTFVNGEEHGITTYWYENGIKQASGEYSENLRNGKWQIWNNDGSKRAEGNCKYNAFHGEWKFWANDSVLLVPFRYGDIRFDYPYKKQALWERIKLKILSESLVLVDQKLGDEIRFIFRMNCRNAYFLERDFNSNHEYHGMFIFRTIMWLGDVEYRNDLDWAFAYSIIEQTAEFIHDVKDGRFTMNSHDLHLGRTQGAPFTDIYYYRSPEVNYVKDLIIGKYKKYGWGYIYNEDEKKSYKKIKIYSDKKPIIRKGKITSKTYLKCDSAKIEVIFHRTYNLLKPFFETNQIPDSAFALTILKNDTVYFEKDNSIVDYFKIPFSEFSLYEDIIEKGVYCFLTDVNKFKVVGSAYDKTVEYNFIMDPLFSKFSFANLSTDYNNLQYYYFNEYFPENFGYKIPYNHLLQGDVIINDYNGKPIEYYLFDYGFLKEYKKY